MLVILFILVDSQCDHISPNIIERTCNQCSRIEVGPTLWVQRATFRKFKESVSGFVRNHVAATVLRVNVSNVIILERKSLGFNRFRDSFYAHIHEHILSKEVRGWTVARIINDTHKEWLVT